MKPVMYLFSNPSTPMSTGKRAAQVAHAAILAYADAKPLQSSLEELDLRKAWIESGHYTKIVLQTDDLMLTERYLNDRGFRTYLVIDEGRTEFDADLTPTALGVVVDKDDPRVAETFGTFRLYRDPPQRPESDFKITNVRKATRWERVKVKLGLMQ